MRPSRLAPRRTAKAQNTEPTLRRHFQPRPGGPGPRSRNEEPKRPARNRNRRARWTRGSAWSQTSVEPEGPSIVPLFGPVPAAWRKRRTNQGGSLARTTTEAARRRRRRRPEGRRRAGQLGLPAQPTHRSGRAAAYGPWRVHGARLRGPPTTPRDPSSPTVHKPEPLTGDAPVTRRFRVKKSVDSHQLSDK